ncbi:MAG: TonB-dependent receptor, partial [Bacteroidetes bacterium]|nr:TonB-dependent receptor [Bacteroidota bacterium]
IGYKTQEVEITEAPTSSLTVVLKNNNVLNEITITSRRRKELAQDVPIPITVVSASTIDDAGAFNVNRVKEIVPSVQLYSSNPRNTGINIRGLGSPFGLTNDGLDPGVGFYVDGVYYARPAAATLDFIDIEQIEVLRGPQGTLFGKNTTAGAFNITTRKASFTPGANAEISYGNYGYVQAKASVTGPLTKKIAVRASFSGTQRDGVIENVRTGKYTNTLNNQGARVQFLWKPTNKISVTLAGDVSSQKPDGYAQVVAGVVTTQRASYRQFDAIAKDLNYTLPSTNAFDRKIDTDVPWKSGNELGGVSLNADFEIGKGTLTSTSAWRYWNWDPSNDRDFTGLQALAKSQNPSKHQNWSQEIRYAGNFSSRLSGVIGIYAIGQEVKTNGTEESGKDQWRFSQSSTSANWKTPGLLDGYGANTNSSIKSLSAAVFAQADWEVIKGLHVLPGIRFNYDEKNVSYKRTVYGGLETTNAALLAIKNGIYSPSEFDASVNENNLSGQFTVSYKPSNKINLFATYATSFKPAGVNVGGLPTDANGNPDLTLAVIKPEEVQHYELGIKTSLFKNTTINLSAYNTDIKNYQTNVQSPELGVNRGYLANAEKVNVRGAELDGNVRINKSFSFYGAVSYTEGKYVKFTNAPLPLEETGATVLSGTTSVQAAFKDISGGDLPGISKWAGSLGAEVSLKGNLIGFQGRYFLAVDGSYRSSFSSSPSPSKYLNISDYGLLNARLGFKATRGLTIFAWGKNILNQNYFEQLLPASGNSGLYAGVIGDPITYGLTLRYNL